ncbi:molybdopterin-guanine dinucleotide biosynthesis protein B [Dickeya solani]|uniref:Molybdopterin-guanine dinucleotide biosynthesis protein B n=1 Tax=Dickeya solani D s0432-1 TaxID=1231725 RepID=A0AAV3KG34_9GAMM|nr:molybdopterin-guanine dinucleotide biosynthesis protein B [Dickeya solani]ANE75713.1 hypothetical protein A4U42_10420 [Dickeya solani IPO 2222]AUC43179.1 Molybdopterin-guanine dinucleotide biosynthesis protein MobB [Dickeya solani RNS 08.23.3.1.A]AUH08877.1 hypothetical protein BJD21_10620 [Dickeya solani D s0432-1]AUH12862.1 hypothetical protein BJJ98_10585 [Dickeya solani]AYQ46126.1 Molybdopterin-guanine dinucleotide biosynthesis adapter protein [Dickeya solani]
MYWNQQAERFKHEPVDKILLYRHGSGRDATALVDADTLAVATDTPLTLALPCLDLNQPAQIAAFIRDWLRRRTGSAGD